MKKIIFTIILTLLALNGYADNRMKIYSLIDMPIVVSTTFSGQSFTLIKEENKYFIIRHFLPSGMKEGPKKRYAVVFPSDYQLRFSDDDTKEYFILSIDDGDKIRLFVNDIEVVVDQDWIKYYKQQK